MPMTYLKRLLLWVCTLLTAFVALPLQAVEAKAETLRLSVRRLSGADLAGHVAGTFSLSVETPDNVSAVTYLLDGRVVGRATSFPFTSQFDTDDYPEGEHELSAVARFADGAVAASPSVSLEFRSRNWLLTVRQSMLLYAVLALILVICGSLCIRRLLHIQPRLALLDYHNRTAKTGRH